VTIAVVGWGNKWWCVQYFPAGSGSACRYFQPCPKFRPGENPDINNFMIPNASPPHRPSYLQWNPFISMHRMHTRTSCRPLLHCSRCQHSYQHGMDSMRFILLVSHSNMEYISTQATIDVPLPATALAQSSTRRHVSHLTGTDRNRSRISKPAVRSTPPLPLFYDHLPAVLKNSSRSPKRMISI
jgi:hypothetical protein